MRGLIIGIAMIFFGSTSTVAVHAAPPDALRSLVAEQRLIAPDATRNANFGTAMALHGDTLVVAAPGAEVAGVAVGAVYVYQRQGNRWELQQALRAEPSNPNQQFGASVALHGEYLAVGAPGSTSNGAPRAGAVFLYQRVANLWSLVERLSPNDTASDDGFGSALAISADHLAVGAEMDDIGANADQGSVRIYTYTTAGTSLQATLLAPDGATSDGFGASLALFHDRVLVGAPRDDVQGETDRGSAHVFRLTGGQWQSAQSLAPSSDAASGFGRAVALALDAALVAQRGREGVGESVSVFRRINDVFAPAQRLTPSNPDAAQGFGAALALSDRRALIGSPAANFGAQSSQGAAFLYQFEQGVWREIQKVVARDGVSGDAFATSVALTERIAAIGAPMVDGSGEPDRGASYVWSQTLFADDFETTTLRVPTVTLAGAPTTAAPGQGFSLVWTATQTQTGNVLPCTRVGTTGTGWADAGPVSGQPAVGAVTVSIPATATAGQIYTFTISCVGDRATVASDSKTVQVFVPEPTCPIKNPHGLFNIGNPTQWPGNFRSTSGFSATGAFLLDDNQCVALAFNSGSITQPPVWTSGRLEFVNRNGFVGRFTMSISRCPCDFAQNLIVTQGNTRSQCRTLLPSGKQQLSWLMAATAVDSPGQCPLRPNTDYFVNFTYGPGTEPENSLGECFTEFCSPVGTQNCGSDCP